MEKLFIEARRQGYSTSQVGETLTVKDLIRILNRYEDETPVYISNDGGYTYGAITEDEILEDIEDEN